MTLRPDYPAFIITIAFTRCVRAETARRRRDRKKERERVREGEKESLEHVAFN